MVEARTPIAPLSPLVCNEEGGLEYPGGKPYEGFPPGEAKGLFPPKVGIAFFKWRQGVEEEVEVAVLSTPQETVTVVEGGYSVVAGMTEEGASYRHVHGPEGELLLSLYTKKDPKTGEELHAVSFHSPEAGVTAVATVRETPEGIRVVVRPDDAAPLLANALEEAFKAKGFQGESKFLNELKDIHQNHEPSLGSEARLEAETRITRVDKNTLDTEFGDWEVVVLTLQDQKGGPEEYLLLLKGPGDLVYRGGRYSATPENVERAEAALRSGEEVKAAQVVDRAFPSKVAEIAEELAEEGHLKPEDLRKLTDILPPDARKEVEEVLRQIPERDRSREPSL